ncbi:MAG: TetR/AcrR family transcriptional regulator, partial [Mycobacteriales bacterium]
MPSPRRASGPAGRAVGAYPQAAPVQPQTMRPAAHTRVDEILHVVVELLLDDGYDAVQVRAVANEARVSLATIYKLFGTRNEMVVAALARWMNEHAYVHVDELQLTGSPFADVMAVLRAVW